MQLRFTLLQNMKPWRQLSVRIFFLQNPEHVHNFQYGRHVTVTLETFGAKKILIVPEVRKIFIQFLFEFLFNFIFFYQCFWNFLLKLFIYFFILCWIGVTWHFNFIQHLHCTRIKRIKHVLDKPLYYSVWPRCITIDKNLNTNKQFHIVIFLKTDPVNVKILINWDVCMCIAH